MKSILLAMIALSFTAGAAEIVEGKTYTAEVVHAQKVNVLIIETEEACVLTIDPRWADDEDTRASRVYFKDFASVGALDEVKMKGYTFSGYQNQEKCNYNESTFPKVVTRDGDTYHSQYTRTATFISLINQQNAWKKVRRVYVKGFEEMKKELEKKSSRAKKDILDRVL